ncbi:hypothetical protein Y032_0137g2022 [Ancylostoma ceylanicum]|uniref:Integrase catalytic domain-containing protein n=1 Tax=Ancylostoma ceylanicum TaxID=53326 RepID=A0A016T520_9BILA|nr:hypothetical protein Y032_0137g2022 [Ancylostoma ceylanicum]
MKDCTTTSFLNGMRRFMSRRGVPESITCDNSPTFTLAEAILADSHHDTTGEDIETFMSKADIRWQKITPYAPWQGGFYERLIKDVKRSLLKGLGRKVVDEDSLTTILTEIEACLNERPLTYQETELDEMTPLRPIDFLQNHLNITYQIDPCQDERDDPSFLPAAELAQLRTKKEAEAALKSSCAMVDKFWKIWNEAYLTSLREHHKRYMAQGRSSQVTPFRGQVVLLQDPVRPRNTWKMGRITALETSCDGQVRQVLLRLPSGNIVKRPINVLMPFKLGQTVDNSPPPSPPPLLPPEQFLQVTTHTNSTRPKRSRQANYPYDSKEYEINTIGIEVNENSPAPQKEHSGMNAKQAAIRLLESLNEKTRSLFEEKEVQRRIDVLYDEISISLKDIDVMKDRFEEIRKQLAAADTQPEENKEIYDDLNEIAKDISVTRERMVSNHHLGEILWEVYDILVKSGAATMSSKNQFEAKPRRSRRDNSRVTNSAILLREINHLDEFLRVLGKTKIDYFVETPKDDLIGERLSHMERILEGMAAPGHDEVEVKELTARTRNIEKIVYNKLVKAVDLATKETTSKIAARLEEKIDKLGQSLNSKLEEIEKKLEKHVELILEAQINTIVQLKKKDDELEIHSIRFSDDEHGKQSRVVHYSETAVNTDGRRTLTIVRDYDAHAAPPECVGEPTPYTRMTAARRSNGGRSTRQPLISRATVQSEDAAGPEVKKARQSRL